ncbi:AfsA-related hotdog domain-containing protein [Nocardiopsis umidischolae]|uniref:AfsA-related hotdog domain-containing protein n=2 Tax=Nocardiopsis tropica TaxID=109330 RepID=A0ABU7KL33_9ACTN|nr:AfsA-related hotdog domain-containing protein [Nocardiopsis umidischolae]
MASVVEMDIDIPADLGFRATLDRTLVHRSAVSEVFVTDLRPVSETDVVAAAQLPLNHGYFSDHGRDPAVFDVLLLLEAGRQAAIAGTHAHMGARAGTQMIVDRFAIDTDPAALLCGDRPGELVIDNRFTVVRRRRDRVRAGRVEQVFRVDGVRAGSHTMDVLFLTPGEYEAVRHAQLGGPAPLTSGQTAGPAGVEPRTVGRTNPLNVVLGAPVARDGALTAEVRPRWDNPSLFDHPYDHLPAAVLTEAARQLALAVPVPGGAGTPGARRVTGVRAGFTGFAELTSPVLASTPADGAATGERRVRFEQDGARIADTTLTVTDTSRLGTEETPR